MDKMGKQISEWQTTPEPVTYPDFEAMWNRIEQDKTEHALQSRAPRKRRVVVMLSAAIIALAATPVLAAVSNYWDLSFRSGVERALTKGYGQTIEQSVQDQGEWTASETYKLVDVLKPDTQYELQYTKLEKQVSGDWTIGSIELDKQKMRNGTF